MAVKLRLMRMGKKKQPTYRVVAADARSPRNGRFIEIVGTYEPRRDPSLVEIDNERALHWLRHGAQPTERVQKLLQISGAWSDFTGQAAPPVVTRAASAEPPATEAPAAEPEAAAEVVAAETPAPDAGAEAAEPESTAEAGAHAAAAGPEATASADQAAVGPEAAESEPDSTAATEDDTASTPETET